MRRTIDPCGHIMERVFVDDSGCWLWMGALNGNGYGLISVNGVMRATHRVMLAADLNVSIEDLPDWRVLQTDHICKVRRCCNPAHLRLVTPSENTRRREPRALVTHCKHGHPFDAENTLATGRRRQCKACARRRIAAFRSSRNGL